MMSAFPPPDSYGMQNKYCLGGDAECSDCLASDTFPLWELWTPTSPRAGVGFTKVEQGNCTFRAKDSRLAGSWDAHRRYIIRTSGLGHLARSSLRKLVHIDYVEN